MGLAFLITSDNLQLLSERKVLKRDEYSAMLDAAGVIDAAHDEAARLRADAEQRAIDERERAYADGLAQARADHAASLVTQAQQAQAQLNAMRDAMARLVAKAVTQIVAEADAARVFESALAKVDALLRDESFVSVRVAPAQEDALRRALAALRERHGWDVGSSRVDLQACKLEYSIVSPK